MQNRIKRTLREIRLFVRYGRAGLGESSDNQTHLNRPSFDVALDMWKERLRSAGHPETIRWLFREDVSLVGVNSHGRFQILVSSVAKPSRSEEARHAYEFSRAEWGEEEICFELLVVIDGVSLCAIKNDSWDCDESDLDPSTNIYFDTATGYDARIAEVEEFDRTTSLWAKLKLFIVPQQPQLSGLDFMTDLRRARRWKKWREFVVPNSGSE